MNVSVTNLTNDAASTALAPVKSVVSVVAPPHQAAPPFSPLSVALAVAVVCLMLVGVSNPGRPPRRVFGTTTTATATITATIDRQLFLLLSVFPQIIIAIRRKRRLDRLRHSLIPFYSFDVNEEEDWDSDLLQHDGDAPTIRVSRLFLENISTVHAN